MKSFLTTLLFLFCLISLAQTKPSSSFDGSGNKNTSVCTAGTASFMTEKDVENLISGMLEMVGVENGYIVKNCTQVDNCQAILFEGKPYILYNANFLSPVKTLNFSEASLPTVPKKDWRALTILAHELGHHVNNHLLNPNPAITQKVMELQADKTAGFMIYLMGGTLDQAQAAYINLPDGGGYTHPGKLERLESIAKGWKAAEEKYPNIGGKRIIPDVPVTSDQVDVWKALEDHQQKMAAAEDEKKKKEYESNDWNDGSTYKRVKIGYKTWMAENLNVTRYNNGDLIPQVQNQQEWAKLTTGAWCYYKNETENGIEYGKLYNWYAVNDPRGLAPEGWHIPSKQEWEQLITYFGGEKEAGGQMKASGGYWNGVGAIKKGFDHFDAMPAGRRSRVGSFAGLKDECRFWSSTQSPGDQVISFDLSANLRAIFTGWGNKMEGFSVRCVKD